MHVCVCRVVAIVVCLRIVTELCSKTVTHACVYGAVAIAVAPVLRPDIRHNYNGDGARRQLDARGARANGKGENVQRQWRKRLTPDAAHQTPDACSDTRLQTGGVSARRQDQ